MNLLLCCLQILVDCKTDFLGSLKELLRGNIQVIMVILLYSQMRPGYSTYTSSFGERSGFTTLHVHYEFWNGSRSVFPKEKRMCLVLAALNLMFIFHCLRWKSAPKQRTCISVRMHMWAGVRWARSVVINKKKASVFLHCAWNQGLFPQRSACPILFMISNGSIPDDGSSADGPGSPKGTVPWAQLLSSTSHLFLQKTRQNLGISLPAPSSHLHSVVQDYCLWDHNENHGTETSR